MLETRKIEARKILAILPSEPGGPHDIWQVGDEILCPKEETADAIADFLEAMGFEEVNTGYYDPAEDEKSGEVDRLTGYYYVSF